MAKCPTASEDAAPGRASWPKPVGNDVDDVRSRLIRFAVKLLWNRQDAEETVQEAFKLALSRGPAFSEERFAPWMFRTVANLCQNLRRRHKPEPLPPGLDVRRDAAPEVRMERAEQFDRLRRAVDRLPAQQRMALVLRTMEQMDYPRIAEIMELSVSAVRTHVHLARQRLIETPDDQPALNQEVRP